MATQKLSYSSCFSTFDDGEVALSRLAVDVSQMVFAPFMDDSCVNTFRVLGGLFFLEESWRWTSAIVRNKGGYQVV